MTIQEFVIFQYGEQTGKVINDYQKVLFAEIIAHSNGKSPDQMITLKNTIVPRIALYKALMELHYSKEEAFSKIKDYLFNFVGKDMNSQLRKLEKVPGFFAFFRSKMYKEISSNDNWIVEIKENNKNTISYNINKCLWYDACKENDCTELCQIFCDVDYIIYGNMKKVIFRRKGTIGTGSAFCDFNYIRK